MSKQSFLVIGITALLGILFFEVTSVASLITAVKG
ncbi:polysaccharide deacetylase family protein, partial [Enterococcus faecium]